MKNKHPKCKSEEPDHCGYEPTIRCDDCKYGGYFNHPDKRRGKNPAAKCNQPKDVLISNKEIK